MKNEFPLPESIKTLDDLKAFCKWLRKSRLTRGPITKREADKLLKLAPVADRMLRRLEAEISMTSLGIFARHDLSRINEFYDAAEGSPEQIHEWLEDVPL